VKKPEKTLVTERKPNPSEKKKREGERESKKRNEKGWGAGKPPS